jgi:hypothetical protein
MMDTKTLEKKVVLIGAILGGCRSRAAADKLGDVMYDIICFNRCVTATQCCPWTSVPLISWLGEDTHRLPIVRTNGPHADRLAVPMKVITDALKEESRREVAV